MFGNLRLNSATVSATTTACGKQLKQRAQSSTKKSFANNYVRTAEWL